MRRRGTVAAIAMVAAVLAIVVPVGFASGQPDSFNGLKDGGLLRLHFPDTNAAATFRQYMPDGTTPLTDPQNITTAQNCGVNGVNPGTPDLARVTATGGTVGAETSGNKFVGLGVKGKQSSGTNCGRVEPTSPTNEALTVALGSQLKLVDGSPAGDGLSVVAAELDIDGKGQAIVRADLFNGSAPVGFALLSTAATTGDSGPDATFNNNFAFPINALMPECLFDGNQPVPPPAGEVCGSFGAFTSLTLSTKSLPSGTPSFALEGGRAGDPVSAFSWDTFDLRANTGTTDSVFKLQQSDGTLDCGDEVTGQGANGTDSFTRGVNNKDGSDCIVVGYEYNNTIATDNKVELLWDTVSQPSATFSLTQTWRAENSILLTDGRPVPELSVKVKWDETIGEIVAPACTSPDLPSQYGTLAAAVSDSDTTIQIALSGAQHPNGDPFLLQIGHEVVSIPAQTPTVSNGVATYTNVTRGAGDTDPASHLQGAKVMTTPFPIIVVNATEIVAKMCISESSWVPTGLTGTNGLPQIQETTTLLAEGDMIGRK